MNQRMNEGIDECKHLLMNVWMNFDGWTCAWTNEWM